MCSWIRVRGAPYPLRSPDSLPFGIAPGLPPCKLCSRARSYSRLAKRAKDAIRLDGMRAFIGTMIPSARTASIDRSLRESPDRWMRVGPKANLVEQRNPIALRHEQRPLQLVFLLQGDPPRQQLI
jgi:hypothetical protein